MATVILDANDSYTAASAVTIRGSSGSETVKIYDGVAVNLDSNVERVEFARASSAYQYKATANGVEVSYNGTVVTTLFSGDNAAFTDGSAVVAGTIVGSTLSFTLGGTAVPSTAGTVVPTLVTTAGEVSTVGGATGGTVAGQPFTLTATAETKVLTTGNDTVDGTLSNSLEGDTIVDASTTDADVLNAVIAANLTSATTISNVETVNITDTFGAKSVDASKFSGVTNLKVGSQYGFSSTVDALSGTNVGTLLAGDKITTLSVTNISNAAKINVGTTLTTLNLDGKTDLTDTATVTLGGKAITFGSGGSNELKTLNVVSSVGANTVTLASSVVEGTGSSINVSGDQNLTIKANVTDLGTTLASGVTKALTGTAKLTVDLTATAAAADLTKVAADNWTVNATSNPLGANDLTFAAGTTTLALNVDTVNSTGGFKATGTATTDVLNATLNKAQTNFVSSGFETVNLTNATGSSLRLANLVVGSGTSGGTVKFLGDKDVSVTTSISAKAVDASGLTGTAKLTLTTGSANSAATTITATANNDTITASGASSNLTITTGDGNDTVVSGSGNDTINAGAGNDTVTLTAGDNFVLAGEGDNIISVTTTGADTIVLGNGNNSVTFAAASGWSTTDNLYGGTGTDTLTLSGSGYGTLSVSDNFTAFDKIDITAAQTTATSITLADVSTSGAFTFQTLTTTANTAAIAFDAKADTDTKFTVTGGSGTAGATIKTGALADTITWNEAGSGAIGITAGKGVDAITLTGSAAVVTLTQAKGDSGTLTAVTNAMSTAGFDVVTGLKATDVIATGNANITGTGASVLSLNGTVNPTTLANDSAYFIEGTYNSTTKTFTAGTYSNATLLVYDADSSAATQFEAIVLVGIDTSTNIVTTGTITLA